MNDTLPYLPLACGPLRRYGKSERVFLRSMFYDGKKRGRNLHGSC
jgi:hypothetical protein